MPRVLVSGVLLAIVYFMIPAALRLLNQPSDAAVAEGYLILLLLIALIAGTIRRLS